MPSMHRVAITMGGFAALAAAAQAQIAWDESVSGDISGDPDAPTAITLGLGSNIITGQVFASDDTRDFVTFTIPDGQALGELRLLEYFDITSGDPGNRGFHAINAGATSFIPGPDTAAFFLGGDHLDPAPAGTDLLPLLAAAPLAGTGFDTPLGPGTYSYVVQQTGPEVTGYSIDLVVIPAPATLAGLGVAGLLVGRRRR
ncbi:MAG: PEP-CTERM sorting domain-containing protein [Planctomycetota bacterium]